MSIVSRARLFGLALLGGVALAVTPSLTASAHVSVSSSDAAPGGSGTLVFRVPTESEAAGTIALSVELPADTPFRSVRAGYLPGWTVELERSALPEPVEIDGFTLTEAVTRVTWTADATTVAAGGVGPDQFGLFEVRVGPFPESGGTYAFPATQTYSDGEVVNWNEPSNSDGSEPEHPAPELTLAADESSTSASDASDTTARWLGGIGLAVGVIGVATAVVALRRKSS